ncbi:MAG: DUF4349 domain-containing protein [Lachnospiraceae bacterium]|nr:DUF4349 domain-containing protein [Lachnospiraceae bacterium]
MKKVSERLKKVTLMSVLSTALLLSLAACGSSSSGKESSSYAKSSGASADSAAYEEYAYDDAYDTYEAGSGSTSGTEAPDVPDNSRKLIKNANLTVETEDFDPCIENITNRVNALGGYIEDSYIYNGSTYKGNGELKSANLTIRIPAKNLDAFLDNVAEFSNITSKNYNVSDITLQYVDLEARRDSIKTQHGRLLELMEKAETVEDIIALEERISNLEYELDSAERQLRSYDNQVDYSTITMNVEQVERYTPTEPKSRWAKMGEGFVNSLYDAVDNVLDFLVNLVIALPHLIIFAIFVLIVVLIVRAIIKRNKKKQEARRQAMMSPVPTTYFPPKPAVGAPSQSDSVSPVGEGQGKTENGNSPETSDDKKDNGEKA